MASAALGAKDDIAAAAADAAVPPLGPQPSLNGGSSLLLGGQVVKTSDSGDAVDISHVAGDVESSSAGESSSCAAAAANNVMDPTILSTALSMAGAASGDSAWDSMAIIRAPHVGGWMPQER